MAKSFSILALILASFIVDGSQGFLLRRTIFQTPENGGRPNPPVNGEPLFLTKYINSNRIDEGRKLSEVTGIPNYDRPSYSGFFTVNATYDSNMFFWFFPALSGKVDTPLLIWLQGGPGGSSLFGLFVENGPLRVLENGNVVTRDETWNQEFSLLFIDNPVGSGFSFTKKDEGYVRNEVEVAANLYEAMRQFFLVYAEYRNQPLFITGESYAGKYVPAFGYKVHEMGQQAKQDGFNLKGLAIGDGFCDPRNMFDYGHYLYQIGLIDEKQRDHFLKVQDEAVQMIDAKEFAKAARIFDDLLDGDFNGQSYFYNATGFTFYYNFLYDSTPADFNYYLGFLTDAATRKAIHVGNLPYGVDSDKVEKHLYNDMMDTVKPWIEQLLDANLRIMFYSGQLDIIVAAPLTENFLKNLQWHGSDQYRNAEKTIYKVSDSDSIAGYVRQAGNMFQVIVRNAGHILPYDQPRVALDMITRFVKQQQPF